MSDKIIPIPMNLGKVGFYEGSDEESLNVKIDDLFSYIFEYCLDGDSDVISNAFIKQLKKNGYECIDETKLLQYLLSNLIRNYEDDLNVNNYVLKAALNIVKSINDYY